MYNKYLYDSTRYDTQPHQRPHQPTPPTTMHNCHWLLLFFLSLEVMDALSNHYRFVTNKMCPFAQKAWCALSASGASFEMEEISLYGAGGKPKWFLELNPQGTVPVVVSGVEVFPDSDDILDAFQHGTLKGSTSLYPDDPEQQQKINEWRSKINKMLPSGKSSVFDRKPSKQLHKILLDLENSLVGPNLCGETLSTADCAAFPFLWRLKSEFGLAEYPKLSQWVEKCESEPCFGKTTQSSWWWWW